MRNIFDRCVSIDTTTHIENVVVAESKRGTKRFCGRIVNKARRDVSSANTSYFMDDGTDLFFDSKSPVGPWY